MLEAALLAGPSVHQPELAAVPEAAVEVIMEQGQEVGLLAHRLFLGGVEVSYDAGLDEAIRTTRELVADPKVPAIFEGTFEPGGVLVHVDVLHRAGTAAGMYSPKSPHRLEDSPPLQDPVGCELIGLQSFNLRGCRFIRRSRLIVGRPRAVIYWSSSAVS